MNVIIVPLTYRQDVFSKLLPALTANERTYIKQKKSFHAQYESCIARIALKMVHRASDVSHDEKGRPITDQASISISHTKGYVAVALHTRPVGIDIERPFRYDASLFMTEKECQTSFSQVTFWTLKEAYVKYKGTGFQMNPTQLECVYNQGDWALNGENIAAVTKCYKNVQIAVVGEFYDVDWRFIREHELIVNTEVQTSRQDSSTIGASLE